MSEFEKILDNLIYNSKTVGGDKLFQESDLKSRFKDWQQPKKLVEVPQFVADFIEEGKEEFKLYGVFFEIEEGYGPGTELYNWVFQKLNGQSLFARAWIDGYTVKKEQLYHVEFPKISEVYLNLRTDTGDVVTGNEDEFGLYKTKFTEQEIKAIDERYWAFAVEVND